MILSFWAALRAALARRPPAACYDKLLVVVEGKHDVEFLRRISRILHGDEARLSDLAELERRGRLAFIPFGGGDIFGWTHRLAGLTISFFLSRLYPIKDRFHAPKIF